jgi:tetraacyldisaccharide 4'-kinase
LKRLDRDAYLRLIRGQTTGTCAALARGGLALASVAYGATMAVRNRGYDRGWLRSYHALVPVVSVGNITLGGTGKTPMVEWLARWFRGRGMRVAILSRGYGHVAGLSDEGRVLEENLPDVPHLQNADRAALARIAPLELETELILLDDGFQHRRLARDLDVVLVDALDPFGLGRLFPRGLLREPVGAFERAHVVVLSRADLIDAPARAALRREIERRAGPRPWVEARHAPRDLVDGDGNSSSLSEVLGKSVAAFCGIGNPEGFRRTLVSLCGDLLDLRVFPDHHLYSAADVGALERWARDRGADLVLTTQKDLVKLRASSLGPASLRALRIGLEVTFGREVMDDMLARLLPADTGTGPQEKDFS